MVEEVHSEIGGQESVPSDVRDFSANPATPKELGEWTEMYRVAPDSSPAETAVVESLTTLDSSVDEEALDDVSGQEPSPPVDEVVPTVPEVGGEVSIQPTPFADMEMAEEPKPEPVPVETSGVAKQSLEELKGTGVAQTEQTPDAIDMSGEIERLKRRMEEYDRMRNQSGGYFVPSGMYGPRYVGVERSYDSGLDIMDELRKMLRDAERSGDKARIAELERQLAEERSRNGQTIEDDNNENSPENSQPAENAVASDKKESVEQPTQEGGYVLSTEETAPQTEHQEQPALEQKP